MSERLRRRTWNQQLVSITEKGAEAFRQGQPLSANPYGPGGSVNRQRSEYWRKGWNMAQQEQAEGK